MALSAKHLKMGDTHAEQVVDNLTRTQIVQYAGASGDYNPIHTDEVYTTKVSGDPSVFAHGMLTMGMTGKMLTNYVGDGRLTKFGVRFTKQVWPGDSLTANATVEALREEGGTHFVDLQLSTVNQNGEEVLSGYASARIDPCCQGVCLCTLQARCMILDADCATSMVGAVGVRELYRSLRPVVSKTPPRTGALRHAPSCGTPLPPYPG